MNNSTVQIVIPQSGHHEPITVIKEINGLVFTGDSSGKICIWDISFDKELGFIKAHSSSITDIEFFPFFPSIVTSSQGLDIRLWSWDNLSLLQSQQVHGSVVINIEFLDEYIITGGRDRLLKKWTFSKGEFHLEKQIKIPYLEEFFVFDDNILISCSDGSISIYDSDFNPLSYLTLKRNKLISAIRKSGKYLPKYKKDPFTVIGHLEGVRGLSVTCFTFDEKFLYLGHFYGVITVWRKNDFKLSHVFVSHDKNITSIYIFKEKVITIALDSKVAIFDISKEQYHSYELPYRPLCLTQLTNENFVIGFDNGQIGVYNSEFHEIKKRVPIQNITCCSISPEFILVGTDKGYVKRYTIPNLEEITDFQIGLSSILGIFYYDSMIAIIDSDSNLRIYKSDLAFSEIKRLSIPIRKEKLTLRGYNRYIVLSFNMIFDFEKMEIMKGEVSSSTKKVYSESTVYSFSFETGNIILNINKDKLNMLLKKEDYSVHPKNVLLNIRELVHNASSLIQIGEFTWVNIDNFNQTKKAS
ncbi:MAG: hypothetical protein K9W46_07960 [Candidatus Heimdallarchaeum endolithica]|uniref:Uncharacterized protein n=1 Tax=Candidatus Heimdallarchaeum endolithica TaxID=2876572 RepID=A0A9Y1BNU8_9ARCH|nr:MAG: hypothetical protein K9W46_07960 [Candidatus Heimdallarchaeum endolithica]